MPLQEGVGQGREGSIDLPAVCATHYTSRTPGTLPARAAIRRRACSQEHAGGPFVVREPVSLERHPHRSLPRLVPSLHDDGSEVGQAKAHRLRVDVRARLQKGHNHGYPARLGSEVDRPLNRLAAGVERGWRGEIRSEDAGILNPDVSAPVTSRGHRTLFVASGFAPARSSNLTQSSFPHIAALWRGIRPCCGEAERVRSGHACERPAPQRGTSR